MVRIAFSIRSNSGVKWRFSAGGALAAENEAERVEADAGL